MTIEQRLIASALTVVPSAKYEAITPADTDLSDFTRAIYVGGAGDITVLMGSDQLTTVTFVGVSAGSMLPIIASQIKAATTATNIVALF